MKPILITIHGINVTVPYYADAMAAALEGDVQKLVAVHWSHHTFRELTTRRDLYPLPSFSIWHPGNYLFRRLMRTINESLVWVRAYEDPEIQGRILEEMADRIASSFHSTDQHLVFVGHSLGSVILIDAIQKMLAAGVIGEKNIWSIVTMGSPLHNWKAPRKLKSILEGIPFRRSWLNLYDPQDPVAGRLAPLDGRIVDRKVSTGAWALSAHTDYWGARSVIGNVRSVL